MASPGPCVVATGCAVAPASPGLHLALVPFVPRVGGVECGTRWTVGSCRDAVIAHVGGTVTFLGVESSGPWVDGRDRAVDPRPLGTHVWLVLRPGLLQGVIVRHTVRNGRAQNLSEREKCATDAGIRCTRCQDSPTHAQHTRRARSGHGRPRVVLVRVYPANTSQKSDRCAR